MIQKNELRAGNFVMHLGRITCCDSMVLCDVFNDYKRPKGYDATDFDPIPLTPEILEKCGFELVHDGNKHYCIQNPNGYNYSHKIHFFPTLNDQWHLAFSDNISGKTVTYIPASHIKYLHQLQNLYFALCGKELEINLSNNLKYEQRN